MNINNRVPVGFAPDESNSLIAALFSFNMDGLALITPDYQVRYANELMARMAKVPLEKVLGNPVEVLIPGWSRQMAEVCQKIRLTGEPLAADFEPSFFEKQPEPEDTYWKFTIGPVYGAKGDFLGWLLVLRDDTKYIRIETEKASLARELENKKTLMNEINENSLAGLAILDGATLTYKWINRSYAVFLNLPYPLNGLSGLSFEESIFPEQKGEWLAKLREVARTRIPLRDSLLNRKQHYWNYSILPIVTTAELPDLMLVIYNITDQITSRKSAEKYANHMEDHLRQLETVIENMGDGVIIFDLNGKILNLNSVALRFLKYADRRECPAYLSQIQADLILYDLEGNILPEESWPSNQIIRGEIVQDFEAAIRKTGADALNYSRYNGFLIKDPYNESTIAMMTIRDITEREILIRQLEREQARLQAILEQMPCGVIMFENPLGKRVLTNKKYMEIWHVSTPGTEIGEQNWPGKFFHPDGRPYLQGELPILRSFKGGETIANEEMLCQRKDGSWMVVICNSAPVLDREGKIIAGVVVFSDITELKEATTKAALANQLQQIIEFLPDGTFVVDQTRKVIAWNRALELLTGISKSDMIGTDSNKNISNCDIQGTLINQIFKDYSIGAEAGADQSGEAATRQILLPRLNQRENVLLDLKATPIRNEPGEVTGVIETIRDITQQKLLEAEAIRMQKLDSLGILAGGIAHDFNNILAAILANLQLAQLKLQRREDITKYLDDTIEATRKASSLTRQLLTFAKGGAPVKKTVSILKLIMDTVEFALRGSKVKAQFHFRENPWAVEIDEGQITQVINNLTINAIQAMPRGGFLEISLENVVLPVESKYQPGSYIKLSVKDSGCGIPADIMDKIFDPFFTTKEVGNGLGLSTSYSIIKRHNGYVEVESAVGSGATFYIYLPALAEEAAIPEVSRQVAAAGESKILLMDDDVMIRQVVGDMLVYNGYRITVAKDGQETIDFYRQAISTGERFEVVIMDLTVPGGMGGLEAMAVLRRIDPQVKAIISSGYANDPVISDYQQYGFCGFVVKPYKFDELIEVVNAALRQK